jgi:hypothetical protein
MTVDPRKVRAIGCALSLEAVEELCRLYLEKQTVTHVATRANRSPSTVGRYVYRGDARRGIEAFAVRYARLQAEAARRQDETIVEVLARRIREVRTVADLMLKKLIAVDPVTGEHALTIPPDFTDLEKILKLEQLLSGAPTSRREDIQNTRVSEMSDAELAAFIEERRRALSTVH